MSDLLNFIGGEWTPSASTDTISVVNPATEMPVAQLPAGDAEDALRAVLAARYAFQPWAGTSVSDRCALVGEVADALVPHCRELAEIECSEMGRPADAGEPWIAGSIAGLRASVEMANGYAFQREIRDDDQTRSRVDRHPLGVVSVILPWNYATTMALGALGPALLCGNTLILKPSEKSSLALARVFELIQDVFPPGVINLLLGDGRSGGPLVEHPDLDLTYFTGSVRTGQTVALAAARNLKRVLLELGGKDPVIIDEDVDIEMVARDVARGAFLNSGQICTSMERVYVHRRVAEPFLEALVRIARTYAFSGDAGNEPDRLLGPLVDQAQRSLVAAHVADAVRKNARVLTGGVIPDRPGYFYPATVLADVTDEMEIMREETFGPIVPVQIVDGFSDALEKASASKFGLGATVYTQNRAHMEQAKSIPAALIWINKWRGNSAGCVFEPARQSGIGKLGGVATFDAFTRPAAVVETRNPPP